MLCGLSIACRRNTWPDIVALHVTPVAGRIALGTAMQLVAIGILPNGRTLSMTGSVAWRATGPAVALAAGGRITAAEAGTATILARFRDLADSVVVQVIDARLVALHVSPKDAAVTVGVPLQLSVTGRYEDGTMQDLTDLTEWQVSDPRLGQVERSGPSVGEFLGLRPGRLVVTARVRGIEGRTSLRVGARAPANGPLRVSAANPRYFVAPGGRTVFLTGSHFWYNLQDRGPTDPPAPFDYPAYLDFVERHGHNFFRLWTNEQTLDSMPGIENEWLRPHPFLRTGPGLAHDGKPRFDVTRFDPEYFERLRSRVAAAGARGIYVSVMLFNGFSVERKGESDSTTFWWFHPFHRDNNINGIDGDPRRVDSGSDTHTLAIPQIVAVQSAYVRRVIDAVGDLDNVLYEISNESHPGSGEWQYHLIGVIKQYEAARRRVHPVGITFMWPGGSNDVLERSSAEWISPGGDIWNPDVADGRKVVLADTDHLCGICGNTGWVWRSITRGQQPLLMDGYTTPAGKVDAQWNPGEPRWAAIRANLGNARRFAERLKLDVAVPRGDLASSGYCLAHASARNPAYLVFVPTSGTVTVDLGATPGQLAVEWFDPATRRSTDRDSVPGGGPLTFTAPFGGDAILFLH